MSTPIFDGLMAEQSRAMTWPPEETLIITSTPEPKWRTFMRCLGWWKR